MCVLRFSTQATSTGDISCLIHYNTVRGGAFEFRVLRENRRVVSAAGGAEELDVFHRAWTDISRCVPSNDVSNFLVQAYNRGAMRLRK